MSKYLLLVTALVEVITGVVLLIAPSLVVELLLGEGLLSQPSIVLGRITGAALVSIGVACLLVRNAELNARRGLISSILIYNLAVPALLTYGAIAHGMRGIAIWPTCVLHLILAIWCLRCLQTPQP